MQLKDNDIFKLTIKRSLWLYYDHIGLFILINLIASALGISIVFFPIGFITIFTIIRMILLNKEENISLSY